MLCAITSALLSKILSRHFSSALKSGMRTSTKVLGACFFISSTVFAK
jgi:hypothetical protein